MEDPRARGFPYLPHKRLREIVINLEATQDGSRTKDRGQIICLFFKTRDVVKMLVEAKRGGMHDALLHFMNTESGEWFKKGFTKKTIARIQDIPTFRPLNDFVVIMLAILPLLPVDRVLSLRCKMEAREWLVGCKTGREKDSKGDTIIPHPIFRKWAETLYAHFDLALDGE
ncbi:hypothetical protein V8E51_009400 [Hyaloscypha variabilis]